MNHESGDGCPLVMYIRGKKAGNICSTVAAVNVIPNAIRIILFVFALAASYKATSFPKKV